MPPLGLGLVVAFVLLAHATAQRPTAVALLPDGAVLVGLGDGYIQVLDVAKGLPGEIFAQHAAPLVRLAVDPRGELVAAVASDGRVALWRVRAPEGTRRAGLYPGQYVDPAAVLRPTPDPWIGVVQLEWSADGSHLATWSFDGLHGPSPTTLQLWTREGELVWTGPHARLVDLHPTRRRLAAVEEDALLLGWPGEDLRRIELEGAHDAVEFSPDGARVAVGGRDHVWLLDAETGAVLHERSATGLDPFGVAVWILRLRWSPDGKRLGVVVGKGLYPAILDGQDLSTVWAGGLFGARMWSIFDVTWTPAGELVTGFGAVCAVNPATGELRKLIDKAEWRRWVPLPGSSEVLLLAGDTLRRFDPATGESRWVFGR